jgi:hypothetical protein
VRTSRRDVRFRCGLAASCRCRRFAKRPLRLFRDLGSGLIDHSQEITVAAMQIADMKVCAHRS